MPGRLCSATLYEGRCTFVASSLTQKFLGDPKVDNGDNDLLGGVDVLSTSPRHLLCTHYMHAKCINAEPGASASIEDDERPTKKQTKKKETPEEAEGGWVQIRDINNPRIHTFPFLWGSR